MVYLEVIVGDASYHGKDALTYETGSSIEVGSIVFVPLKNKIVPGIVSKIVNKPKFKTKPVSEIPDLPALPQETIDLILWMKSYYPSAFGTIVQLFTPKALAKKKLEPLEVTDPIPLQSKLTADQANAISIIQANPGTNLLHGATGTGKTRVYIELAQAALAQGKTSIILSPEIGLTSQLSDSFRKVFGNRVIVLHSHLTEATRRRIWEFILSNDEPLIIIGARSALFSPVRNLGLIVIDEAHETAYKQDKSPYYLTTHVAGKMAYLHKIPLVLGSATPLIADFYFAQQKNRPIISMTQVAAKQDAEETDIHIVDLRDHEQFTKSPYLSNELIESMRMNLAAGKQALLFLNRRGTARVVLCNDCGWQAVCPHCDIPLVYHSDSHSIRCHSCNFNTSPPLNCPDCHNDSIMFKSAGTKAILDDAKKLFPNSSIMRFDTDNTKDERFEQHYESIRDGKVDIIVGTQTIAKGLDLPLLGVVGVVAADTSLYVPDFSSYERTYQLLSQVVGRVGRGHSQGKVFIQTYDPNSIVLSSIVTKDWQKFYSNELREREQFLFPPYCYLLKIWCRRATAKGAQNAAQKCATLLRSSNRQIRIEGPAPSFHEKINEQYEWQIIVKAKKRSELIGVISDLPPNWQFDIDPMNLL